MSELPTIDPAKIIERDNLKLKAEVAEYKNRETHLELLAEALRDQRDEALRQLSEAQSQLQSTADTVQDISSLPNE